MAEMSFSDFLKTVGPIAEFKPCAYYVMDEVHVVTKNCSYSAEWLNAWANVCWENHRPWYAPWRKCVGFSLYCPSSLGFSGKVRVSEILDRIVSESSCQLDEKYQKLFYRLARDLTVQIPPG